MNVTVLYESWRLLHPLSWIHRAEARSVAAELRRAGHAVRLARFSSATFANRSAEPLLLRVSDPVMCAAAQALARAERPFLGPSAAVMERCYDKYEAYRIAIANDVDCPPTRLANDSDAIPLPSVLKPRRGSDSIGMRILRAGPIPPRARTDRYIAQQRIVGAELTVAVLRGRAGMPLRIFLPAGTPYSFFRKYLVPPRRAPLPAGDLAERVRRTALRVAAIFGVDWAARVDLIHEAATDRLFFLECDVAPLIGARSAFAASFEAAGVGRAEQLNILLTKTAAGDRPPFA